MPGSSVAYDSGNQTYIGGRIVHKPSARANLQFRALPGPRHTRSTRVLARRHFAGGPVRRRRRRRRVQQRHRRRRAE